MFSFDKLDVQETFLANSMRTTGRMSYGPVLLKPEGIRIFVLFNFRVLKVFQTVPIGSHSNCDATFKKKKTHYVYRGQSKPNCNLTMDYGEVVGVLFKGFQQPSNENFVCSLCHNVEIRFVATSNNTIRRHNCKNHITAIFSFSPIYWT